MFVDYLTIMLINMVSALVLFAWFMWFLMDKNPRRIIPGFLVTGFIALATGLPMVLTWPLPGAYNIMFGELTVLFGAFLFMAGLAIAFGWELVAIGVPAFATGAVAVLLGVRVLNMNLTSEPLVAAGGYVVTGITALLTLPALALPKWKWLRFLVALAALGSAAIWAAVGFPSYWAHISSFAKWAPGGPK